MNILSIDYGDEKIGIAKSSNNHSIIFPCDYVQNNNQALNNIYQICIKNKIDLIVIGMPYLNNKTYGEITEKVKTFAQNLKKLIHNNDSVINIEFIDERFSSKIASQSINNIENKQYKKKYRQKNLDSISAQIILERHLNHIRKS